jgi:hypothetical protein
MLTCIIQIVLDQFVVKLIQIQYIQICYIQFRINLDTFGYQFLSNTKIVVDQFVHQTTAKKKICEKNQSFDPQVHGNT